MTDTLITANSNYFGFRPAHEGSTADFVVTSGFRYHIRNLHITNTNASWGAWFRYGVNYSATAIADSDWLTGWMYIPARETINLPIDLTMEQGQRFHAQQINEMNDSGFWVDTLTDGGSTTDGTSFTTASFSSATFRPTLLSVVSTHASAAEKPSSITGAHTNYAWEELQSILSPNGTARLTQYRSSITSGQTGTMTFNFASTMTGCLWALNSVWSGDFVDNGKRCLLAAGTYSDANSGTAIDVLPSHPAAGKLLAMSGPTNGGYNILNDGWNEVTDQSIATPTQELAVHWSRHTGDQHGRAIQASATAQRIAGMVCVQDNNSTELQSIVIHYSGVKESI